MKRRLKKLTLNRETLHGLGDEIKAVAAGAYTDRPRICTVDPACTGPSACVQCVSSPVTDCIGCTGAAC
jgi:hypothetical protein